MSIAKVTEISSTSTVSFQDAIAQGLARASETLDGITGAWVDGQKVECDNGRITIYRVNLKISFILKG